MFVRRKLVNGVAYYQVVENFRVNGSVYQRVVVSLGPRECKTLQDALHAAEEKYLRQVNAAMRIPSTWGRGDTKWIAEYRARETYDACCKIIRFIEKSGSAEARGNVVPKENLPNPLKSNRQRRAL